MTDVIGAGNIDQAFIFNPFTAGFSEDPYPYYAKMRAVAPAHEHPLGFWMLSRYEDVSRIYRSEHSVDERRLKKVNPHLGRLSLQRLSLLDLDPPDHTRIRRLVTKAFSRRSTDVLEPLIQSLVDEALDRIAAAGTVDLVAELASPFPLAVISKLLGMPRFEHTRVRELTETLGRAVEPFPDPNLQQEILSANDELTAIIREVVNWKRTNPGNDLISALMAVEDEGDVLAEDEMIAQILLLYAAGHETTVNLVSGGVLALLRHPDQLRLLQEDPGLIVNAVDELLRYDSPAQFGKRITIEPFYAQGREIPPGTFVITCLGAANRDPDFWGADAAELHLDRPNAHQSFSFGGGIHRCIGAGLARQEAQLALGSFVRRFRQPAVERVRWNGRMNLRGPAELVVSVQ